MQGRMLLDAVGSIGKQHPPLVAFFGLMDYAALRPEEAAERFPARRNSRSSSMTT